MVQSPHKPHEFPPSAPVAYPLFYRTYSRMVDGQRETWEQMCHRTIQGLKELGDLTEDEALLMTRMQRDVIALPSGRWLWVGGTDWVKKPENFPGAFNCSSTNVIDWRAFGLMMDLAMQGCGTGAVLEDKYISQIPAIRNRLNVTIGGEIGTKPPNERHDDTVVIVTGNRVVIRVGDSRHGWASSYQELLELSTDARLANLAHTVEVSIDLSSVRPSGEPLKGFGGMANPIKLPALYGRCAAILNRAVGRKLTAVECCLLIDEAAGCVVAGNIRRCLPEDAMVHTDHGLVPIKDVQIGDMVQTPLGFRRVANKFDQGIQDVYQVPCNHPVLPRATLKHRMAVVATDKESGYGWKPVWDLEPGDLLLYTTFEAYDFSQGIGLNSSICVTGMPTLCESTQTYDIEVEEAHCFYCDGYLTHNSAGIRQFDSFDELAAIAKDNLWQQGTDGEWRIDPERDALRMANHTRVFHQKPSLDDCIAAVTKQFWSGEGAIQWAGEAKRRANIDLLDTPEKQQEYMFHCIEGTEVEYLSSLMDDGPGFVDELEHRTQRYGLNPCLVGSTKLLTPEGYKPIEELVSDSVKLINKDGDVVTGKVWCSGEKETVILSLSNCKTIQCTADHVFQLNNGFQSEAKDLKGKQLMPFLKQPTHDLYWVLLGFIQGDGCLSQVINPSLHGVYLNVGKKDLEIATILDQLDIKYRWHGDRQVYAYGLTEALKDLLFDFQVLPNRKLPTTYPEWSLEQKAAFLAGVYAANGSVLSTGRFTLKATSLALIEQIKQSLEDDFGIDCYYTTNKSKPVQFGNGVYQCKESYDLNIQSYKSRQAFFNTIGFGLSHKVDKAAYLLTEQSPTVRAVKPSGVEVVYDFNEPLTNWGVAEGFITHNCGEIIGANYFCNLAETHLNQINPFDFDTQREAFTSAALSVAVLLKRQFTEPRYHQARDFDPIVGVSFTGLFDFFVNAFGVDWLRWWEAGRPDDWASPDAVDNFHRVIDHLPLEWNIQGTEHFYSKVEQAYLSQWKAIVHEVVWDYCDRHHLKRPNRCTTVQPAGSKSLLTGASPGWHPPKAQRFIRRVTFRKGDPVALACIDYGYTVVPSQSDKDEDGNLLNDPFDPRCTEWLVEIPVEVPWANLPGADAIHIERFSVAAQFDFYMQVQKYYTTHNASATLEIRQGEIKTLAALIYTAIQDDEGYISAAILARFDDLQTFPRLPFEPIDKATYESLSEGVLQRRVNGDFHEALARYDAGETVEAGPAGCDSDKCMMPEKRPE